MKLKESYFKNGMCILLEDFKRFWGISALYTLMLFLSNAFPIMMAYDTLSQEGYYLVYRALHNETFFSFLFLVSAPIVAAILIFRYLQNNNSVAVMHSFPFSRKELYLFHSLSGILLTMIPIVLNTIVLFFLKTPVSHIGIDPTDIFTSTAIFNWMGESIIITILGFSIAVFAGIISGNSILHMIFGFGFLFLIPAMGALFIVYFDEFLFGFNLGRNIEDFLVNLSPITAKLANNDLISGYVIWYIALTIVLFIVSYVLYLHRKLERATDSFAFGFLKPIFKYSVAFCGMSLFGLYFMELSNDNKLLGLYVGFILGSLIAYIISEMIVHKTIWIFKHMKGYLLYLIIAVVFVVFIQTDITGFEKRMPDIESVKGIYLGDYSQNDLQDSSANMLSAKDNIDSIYAFHKSIVENKKWLEKDTDGYTYNITLNYIYEHGDVLSRQYQLPYEFFIHNPYIKDVYESSEYKISTNQLFDMDFKDLEYISLESSFISERSIRIIDPIEIQVFLSVLKNDLLNESFEEMMSKPVPICNIDFTWKATAEDEVKQKYYSLSLKRNYDHTISWLESKGYLEQVAVTPEDVKYVTIQRQNNDTYVEIRKNTHTIPSPTPELMVLTDTASIETLLTGIETRYYKDNGYRVTIVFDQDEIYTGFYQNLTAPSFVINYFNNTVDKEESKETD